MLLLFTHSYKKGLIRGGNMANGLSLDVVILAIIVGTLAAIVYSLRVLVLLERRIARVDKNIESIARRVVFEEHKISVWGM